MYLDNNRPEDEVDFVQNPIVGVEMYNGNEVFDPQKFKIQKHAVVLEDHKQLGFWIEFKVDGPINRHPYFCDFRQSVC